MCLSFHCPLGHWDNVIAQRGPGGVAAGLTMVSASPYHLGTLNMNSKIPRVAAVAAAEKHTFSKEATSTITLMLGLGVQGDAHCGACVQHLYDKARDPARPNLRQVHLVEQELIKQVRTLGFNIGPGQFGENITTCHLSLTELEGGTVLQLGTDALIQITGLREPCVKIDHLQKGLRKAITANRNGQAYMQGAVMGVVIASGTISVGDVIRLRRPANERGFVLRPV